MRYLVYIATSLLFAGTGWAGPPELGSVTWFRDYEAALALAEKEKKPVLILFQEVPGCSTCVRYGQGPLSHPLVVEAAETLFIPVAIFNNKGGLDAKVLHTYNEPAWNNPVVRIVNSQQEELAPRLHRDYSVHGLAETMVTALRESGSPPPPYLELLVWETSLLKKDLEYSVFAMPCFWTGESALGGLEGVVATKPGFLQGHEVVEVVSDPERLPYHRLVEQADQQRCAAKVFTRNHKQQETASRILGERVVQTDEALRPDRTPKYRLAHSSLRYVPMTPVQATRVNAALGMGTSPERFLSPGQVQFWKTIMRHSGEDWEAVAGQPNLIAAWAKATQKASSLGIRLQLR